MKISAMLFTILLVLSLAVAVPAFAEDDIASAAYLSKLAKDTEKKLDLPLMVDDETQLVSIEGFDHEFQYNYILVNYSSDEIEPPKFMKIMREQLIENVCSNKALKPFLESNVALSYTYKGNDNKRIGKVSITSDMCE